MFRRLTITLVVFACGGSLHTANADVVLNEVLGSTTSSDTEYIELYNRGPSEVDISGWSVILYDSDDGSSFGGVDGGSPYTVPAETVLMPGQHYLFANALAANAFNVTPDVQLPSSAIENSSYTIVLRDAADTAVNTVFVVDSGANDQPNIAGVVITPDLSVGPDGSNLPAGFYRTEDGGESIAFLEFSPIPADSGTPTGSTPPADAEPVTIMEIQGRGHTSPLLGALVSTSGVVTATDSNGFYLQDANGDGDDATSDAIFLFTNDAPSVVIGDAITVEGSVSEFFPGGQGTGNLSQTQIRIPQIEITSSANSLPAPVIMGIAGRPAPNATIDDDAFASFDPATDGIDYFESLEAMRVTVPAPRVVAPISRFGEIFTVADSGAGATGISSRGTLNISPMDFNPEKIQIDQDTGILPDFRLPAVNTGATLSSVTGVISYDFGNFQVHPTEAFTFTPSMVTAEVSSLRGSDSKVSIASYNLLNLDPNDADGDEDIADGRFAAIASQIVNNLNSPDVLAVQEIQDDDGSDQTATTAANLTLQTLADAIVVAGGPSYAFVDTVGLEPNSVGGQPGGNIRVAYLYNPARITFSSASALTDPVDQASNSDNPFFGSRISLAAEFNFNGELITIVNNHLSSKGGSEPILGVEQPFDARQEDTSVNGSLDERQIQAQAVSDYVDAVLSGDPDANIVVLGDMNEFEFVSPVQSILGASLTNSTDALAADERYSFIFQGNSQQLDHILLSQTLAERALFDIVHVNAEFVESAQRASDHDPLLVLLDFTTERVTGDLDGDGDLDYIDYRRFLRTFRLSLGQPGYNPLADLDDNDRINGIDLRLLLQAYRMVMENLTPGDIDRDGDIDRRDRRLLFWSLESRIGQWRYIPDADLNLDNRINYRDVRLFDALTR